MLVKKFFFLNNNSLLEEAQQREIFFQNQGRYLPIDLCPPIQVYLYF